MEIFCNGSATIDEQLILRKADEAFYQFIGQDIYAPITHRIHSEDQHRFREALEELNTQNMQRNVVSVRLKGQDGNYCWVTIEVSYEPFLLDGKSLFHLSLSALTASKDYNNQLRQKNQEHEILLGLMNSIILSYCSDTDRLEIFMGCDSQKIYLFQGLLSDWKKDFLNGKLSYDSTSEFYALCRDMEEGKRSFHHSISTNGFSKNGSMELCVFRCRTLQDSYGNHKVLGCITSQGNQQDVILDTESLMDTGISVLNKKAITDYAKKVLLTNENKIYLVILDLDNFKEINDTFGHMFGDEVLSTTAEIIKSTLGNSGVVGRIGGDEMMLVLTGIESHAELRNMLRAIRMNIEWSYKESQKDLRITCSIGVAAYPDHSDSYEKLFQLADRMLYIAKQKGKNRYVIYTPEIHDATLASDKKESAGNNLEHLREDKSGVLQRLIDEFLIRKIITYERAMTELIYCFELDEIIMVYENISTATIWSRKGVLNSLDDKEFLSPETGFLNSFDANHILVMNSIFNLEGKAPLLNSKLQERGVKSALFYKMTKHDKMLGYIMFAKTSRGQMWSEYEKTLFAMVGKIIELSMTDR